MKPFWKDTVSDRDRALLERASAVLTGNVLPGDGYPWSPLRGIVPSLTTYAGVWNWDAAFHALAVARWDKDLAYEQCRIIWNTQKENGMFCDATYADGKTMYTACKPPVFPWAFMRAWHLQPDEEMLRTAYEKYKKNESFWVNERSKNGLFHYWSEDGGIYARYESGWDTSVRWDRYHAENLYPIDLNCYAVMMYRALFEMAQILKNGDGAVWQQKEQALSAMIERNFWDESLQAYTDITIEDRESTGVLSPASFMPLYIGIAPRERAAHMAALASDPTRFYPLMPTVSYDDPGFDARDYWRGPTWLNTAYFALKGLKEYGYCGLAEDMKERLLDMVAAEKRGIYEYYDARTGEGLGAHDFGWSAAFAIELILGF